jgi:uncharacterized protein YecA (UPF0149 family)
MMTDRRADMAIDKRSAFHQQVVEALLDSKAIDLAAVGAVMSEYGERAARQGESLVQIINRNVFWNCGWPIPGPEIIRVPGLAQRAE